MRSLSSPLVGLSAILLVVSACGGGSDDSSETTSPTTEAAPVTEVAPATEAPAATEAPNPTEAPAPTEAPSETEAPTTTEAPADTEAPPVTEPVQTIEPGVLTVGRYLEATPLAADDGSGNVVGFEPDLVDEMAARLGLTLTWIDAELASVEEFQTLLDDLQASRYDMVASNVTRTPDRAEQFGFTAPYFWSPEAAEFNVDFANSAFPIDPANPDLQVALSDAFDSMLADGTYQSIYDTWFDTPEMSVLHDRG